MSVNMFKRIVERLHNVVAGKVFEDKPIRQSLISNVTRNNNIQVQIVPYDEELLERSRIQWQFGDWESLVLLDHEMIQHHPDRAQLALLASAGHHQLGNISSAQKFVGLAQEWGCSNKMLTQIIIAGVYNSLGRAAAISGQQQRAQGHFESALSIGIPKSELRLLTNARMMHQLAQVGLGQLSSFQTDLRQNAFLEYSSKLKQDDMHNEESEREIRARAEYLNANGETFFIEGNYKIAVEYFQRAFNLIGNEAIYCQNLAEALARLTFKNDDQWECKQLAETIKKIGKWEIVVRHYRQALKLDQRKVEAHRNTQTFSVAPFEKDHIDNPVFIVGCGHSGTSIMLTLLGHHPNFFPIPKESALFLCNDEIVQQTMRQWDLSCREKGKSRWVEKTPPHIFQIHRFLAFRPNSKIIIMLRDGRDVVCSLKSRQGYENFQDRLERWIYDNAAGLFYWDHPQVKVVQYEDIVTNTEGTLRTICDFLDEEYSGDMLNYHMQDIYWYSNQITKPVEIKTPQDHMNNRNWQINQPVFDGRGRWLQELAEVEKEIFKHSLAQEYLEQFEYVFDKKW